MATRRARSDEDKLARRTQILDAARAVFDRGEVDAFTMDASPPSSRWPRAPCIATSPPEKACCWPWPTTSTAGGSHASTPRSARPVARRPRATLLPALLVDEMLADPRFLRLAALVPSVLERNVPFETAMEYKCHVVERSRRTTRLRRRSGSTSPTSARCSCSSICRPPPPGLFHAANPAPIIVQVMADPGFPGRRTDLRAELLHNARALVQAAVSSR